MSEKKHHFASKQQNEMVDNIDQHMNQPMKIRQVSLLSHMHLPKVRACESRSEYKALDVLKISKNQNHNLLKRILETHKLDLTKRNCGNVESFCAAKNSRGNHKNTISAETSS